MATVRVETQTTIEGHPAIVILEAQRHSADVNINISKRIVIVRKEVQEKHTDT